MYSTLWQFDVRPDAVEAFERAYGSNGLWAQLFRHTEDYLGTVLLKDRANPLRYITIDQWISKSAFDRFLKQHKDEYAQLDSQCEQLTLREQSLGAFSRMAAD